MSKKSKLEQDVSVAHAAEEDRGMLAISRALSDPSRTALLRAIAGKDNMSCMELRAHLDMTPATLSHHVRLLEAAGLVETRRDGKLVRVELRRKMWKSYVSWLKDLA